MIKQEYFYQYLEYSNDIVIITDQGGKILHGNKAAQNLFPLTEKKSHYLQDFIHDLSDKGPAFLEQCISGHAQEMTFYPANYDTLGGYVRIEPIIDPTHNTQITAFACIIFLGSINDREQNQEKSLSAEKILADMALGIEEPFAHIDNLINKHLESPLKTRDSEKFTRALIESKDNLRSTLEKMFTQTKNSLNLQYIPGGYNLEQLLRHLKEIQPCFFKSIEPKHNFSNFSAINISEKCLTCLDQIMSRIEKNHPTYRSEEFLVTVDPSRTLLTFELTYNTATPSKKNNNVQCYPEPDLLFISGTVELLKGQIKSAHKDEKLKFKLLLPCFVNQQNIPPLTILLIMEQPRIRADIQKFIERQNFHCHLISASDPISVERIMASLNYHIIIIDPIFKETNLPQDSEKLLQKWTIRAHRKKALVLSISPVWNKIGKENRIFEFHVDDYLRTPFQEEDLHFKIHKIIHQCHKLNNLSDDINTARKGAITDSLTKLFNRGYYDQYIRRVFEKSLFANEPFAIIMCDIDDFKHYNDTNGHLFGDKVLRQIARVLEKGLHTKDFLARYGGEEFVIVLTGVNKNIAKKIAEKLRYEVEKNIFPKQAKQPGGNLTASFGIGVYPENGNNYRELFEYTDRCLYHAKKSGRNQVSA